MKSLNFAIASIVDANTGNGVNQRFIEQFASASSDYEYRGRKIRAKSILAVIAKVKTSIRQYIEDSRARARNRRDTEALLGMNEHLLRDIGLTSGDLHDLRWGQTSLDTLNTRRELNRIQNMGQLLSHSSSSVGCKIHVIETAHDEIFEHKKCA